MIDLAGLEGSYVAAATLSRRARRVWTGVVTVVVLAVVGWVATLVVVGGPGEWRSAVLSVLPGLLAGAGPWVAAARPPRTRLRALDLVVRTGFLTERTVAWDQVLAVRPPGRWDVHSTAQLRDGTELPLPGLDLEQTHHLADAVARLHPPGALATGVARTPPGRSPSSPPPRRGGPVAAAGRGGGARDAADDLPEDEGDWQGPFRTRPGRPRGGPADAPHRPWPPTTPDIAVPPDQSESR